jgi:hypothetical protein
MVFGAITLFTLALFTVSVWVIGMNSGDHMQNQTAADSAAYSGALVEAESLESIAFLNDGMAFVYYTELRYAIDAVVYSTLTAFEKHDQWVEQKQSGWLQDSAFSGPGLAVETGSAQANNPGANGDKSSYSPGVEPTNPGSCPDYGFVEMGASSGGAGGYTALLDERFKGATARAKQLIPQGKQWLADIHYAERVILTATPSLVKKACIDIALKNGAEYVAVSPDIDQTWVLPASNGQGQNQSGFTEGSGSGGGVDTQIAQRYEFYKSNPIDGMPRPVPGWFSDVNGASTGQGYSQIRLCWNKRDWDHCMPTPYGQAPYQGAYDSNHGSQYPNLTGGAPAGHWIVRHLHLLDEVNQDGSVEPVGYIFGDPSTTTFTHDYGHGIQDDGGPDDPKHVTIVQNVAQLAPGWAQYAQQLIFDPNQGGEPSHHCAQTCPTCGAQTHSAGSTWAEVEHTEDDGNWVLQSEGDTPQDMTTVTFNKGDVMPKPLMLASGAFRAGVTVATWRHSRGFTTAVFQPNDFGDLAIASAQIGLRDPTTNRIAVVTQLTEQQATFTGVNGPSRTISFGQEPTDGQGEPDNLFLGGSGPGGGQGDGGFGMRFGARLVPVARDLSWLGGASNGLGALVSTSSSANSQKLWWTSVPTGVVQPGQGGQAPSGDLQTALTNLNKFVNLAGSAQDLAQ